ncbi:AHH domain-containing protein [Pseudoalteromonas sp. XMcav11-Q]|uniref:AHH domain-containing protein n=1 Tax=Pseudoalteromonas sp. XMcav11-Q TaxID=3136665 RepID=UPI0032C44DCB
MSEEIEEGIVVKDTKFRARLIKNIKQDITHPFNNGIHMAAHHLISNKGVNLSKLGKVLIHKGYNINLLGNLVFLPSTLQGACQLRVQLHRYNHTFSLPNQKSYHYQVASSLRNLKSKIGLCSRSSRNTSNEIQNLLDSKSEEILERIAYFRVPLTPIFRNFKPSSKVGCSNKNEIKECSEALERCNRKRNHTGEINFLNPNAKSNKVEKEITYKKSYYKLKVGG